MNLMLLIGVATDLKPKFGEPCNNCGWCCLTEVCQMGEFHGASSVIPCEFLVSKDDKHYCKLVIEKIETEKVMCIGQGCCAKTQIEVLQELT